MPAAVGAVALLIVGYLLWHYDIFPPPALGPAPSWRGITPGQTTLDEALEILGDPDEFEMRGDYLVYIYRIDNFADLSACTAWGWIAVELWVQERENGRVVVGVFRVGGCYGPRVVGDFAVLNDLVAAYGRPDEVSWGDCHQRVLIWARQGVMAKVWALLYPASWQQQPVISILVFEPMSIRQFRRTEWPWYGQGYLTVPARQNQCPADVVESLPEDPFDWREILSSQP